MAISKFVSTVLLKDGMEVLPYNAVYALASSAVMISRSRKKKKPHLDTPARGTSALREPYLFFSLCCCCWPKSSRAVPDVDVPKVHLAR